MFNENKKENITKIEKIQNKIEEISDNIDTILDKLGHTPSDRDFSQFQDIIKNMIENIVIKNKKQFANKFETVKSYKLLETKLNSINDSYNKKANGAENWLLAKKPLNSYQCASCESLLKGDLEPKNEYIPWNKYPNREENKSYRMGHGFSHMLQMINEGIIKESESEEEKKKIKKGEIVFMEKNKKNNFEELPLEMLPKLKKKSKIYNLSSGYDSPLNISREKYNNHNTIDNQQNTPHIMKIMRKNKSSLLNSIISQNIQTEKPKSFDRVKFLNFNVINNKETE